MADRIDIANEYYEKWLKDNLSKINSEIPEGKPGVCDYCDKESPRLIGGVCARCRDKYRLK